MGADNGLYCRTDQSSLQMASAIIAWVDLKSEICVGWFQALATS